MAAGFEFLEHTADIKVRVWGETQKDLFEQATLAVSSYLTGGEEKIKSKKVKVINVSGTDISSLLYNFLEELLFLLDAEQFAPSKASVFLRGNNLKAEISGDDTENYKLEHIKAATYAEMKIEKLSTNSWQAFFVLDV
jgi:SHS2 domain-containing protein